MKNLPKVRPKLRKELNKPESETKIIDEWEIADIDRDEQKEGLKRRERRWKEIELENIRQKKLRELAVKKAEKMDQKSVYREPNELEKAWLQCDYILWNIMQKPAYEFMEYHRTEYPDIYKKLYRVFISPYMMENAEFYVDYFANGGKLDKPITLATVIKEYKKIMGVRPEIRIIHKGEKERKLGEENE